MPGIYLTAEHIPRLNPEIPSMTLMSHAVLWGDGMRQHGRLGEYGWGSSCPCICSTPWVNGHSITGMVQVAAGGVCACKFVAQSPFRMIQSGFERRGLGLSGTRFLLGFEHES